MDEKQIKLLWDLDAKNGGFSSYDEFRTLMQNDNARKAYFDASNKDLGFKDYDEFETTLGVKKKEGLLSSVGSYGTPSQMGSIVGGAVGTLNGNSQKLNGSNISSVSSTVEQPVNVDDDPVKFALSPYRAAANKALTDLQNVDKSGNESIGSMGDFGIKLDVSRSGLLRDEYNKRAKALNQAEQQSNNLFRTTANAYNYLVKKNEENNGTLPDDNETVNLALKKVSNAQAIDDLWKKTGKYTDANKNFENFAFNLIEGKNSDNAPEAKRGEYVYETLNDPTVIERASLNPEFNKALRTANANLYNNYPSFANKKIGQDLAQIMEDNKMINALYDNPGTDKTDKAANLLLNEGKWGNREYNYYIKKIRPIVERGDADKIIPLTDIAHQAGYALYEGTKGYNQSMRDAINFLGGNFLDKNGNSLWQNLGLLESNQSEQQRKEQEKYATPFAKPKGVKAYIESPINMAAGIAPMILGGMVGVPSSVNMALQFGSGNAEKANDIFPGNDIKSRSNRFAYTLASTSIDMTLMDLLPINKLLEAKRALEPTIRGTIRSLANGEISRAEVKPLLLDKLGNYLKTVPKNLIENANVLTAYNYAHAGLGALAGDRNIKAEEIGQNLIGDYLNNLLAGSALSLLHFKPGDKPRFEEAQYLRFANNYGAYKTALENRLKEHPEESQSINEKLDNLLYLKNVKDGMNPDMSDKKKARLLTISLKEKVLNDAKRAMPDKDLFDNSKIDELKKQKEEVLNTEEKPEEKVEPTESRETSKMPQTDDEWKESIATAPDEATKDELMKKHGEWIIAQKKVSDKVKSKLSEFKLEEEPEAKGEGETEIKGQAVPDEASNPSIQSAVINVGGKQYEGKNHAEAILKAKADGQDISSIDRQAEGKFKLSDGTIIDRNEAMQKFGNDKAELLIPQDEVAKQADKDYAKEIKNNSNLDKTQEDVKLAKHPTEHELAISKLPEEAKEFAKNSNKYATLQTDIENTSYYHDKLKAGESYNSVLAEAKENEQEGSAKRIVNLAHLNPKGKAMEALEALDKGEGDTKDNVLKIASKIGDIRSNNPHLTDAHENELFDHFVSDKDNIPTDKEINDPNNQINRSINAVRFDTNEPLNLEKFQNKSDARIEWENRRKELEQQVSELRQEVNPSKKTGWTGLKERIIAKLTGGDNSKKAIDKAAEGFNSNKDGIKDIYDKQLENEKKELQVVSDKLAKHLLQEKNIIEGDKRQQSLFHTTESESPKLSQMKDIVKDLVDEGYTNLSDIHEIVARETKNDSPKLKQLVTDAYNEYGKEKENTSTEVTSGVIGKVSQWLKKVFGEDNANKPKILSSKDDADFERRVREDAGKEDGDVLFHKSPEGKILGATVNGKIYLNGNHINPNTPIHEAGHIWVEVAKQHTPEIYDRGIKLVSDADNPYMKKVKSNEFYKSEASKAGKEGSPEYEQYMQHEALAMAIGDKGAQFVTEAKKSAFKEWLSNLWDMVKKAAGFKDITTEELQNLTFDEFTKRAARDILQGEVPEKESGGIRHADTKIIRERHGFEPYEKKPQTEEQWEQEAERRIKENPDAVNELLDRIDKSQRNEELGLPSKLDTDEADQKILDIHVNKLDKELQSNPSPEKLQELRRAVSLADYSGTKLGRELRSRRSSGLPMDSLGQFLLNKENAQGANLTGKQVIEQSEKYKELKKAHDEFKEAYEKEKSERERLQIENEILKKGGKGSGIKKSKSDYVTERKSLVELLKKQKQEHEKWLEEQGIQRMGFGITLTTDMAKTILKIAKSYAEEGVDKLETLVDKVGEAIKDVFPEITNSDIMDVLGNRNKTQDHEKTKAENKNLLKSLRKEAELIRKIADARKGIEKEKNERTIAQKTKRIQELEEQYNKIKSSNEKEFSEEDLQNSLMDRIRKVKHDLKTKEFLKEKTKNKVNIFEKMSPKTTKMQDQLIELQIKRDVELYKDQLSKRTKWQKGWDIIQQALGIKRLVQTSIDVSLLGRQLVTVTKNPRRWMHVPKIVRGTLSSFANPKVFNRIMFNIKSDPDYQLMLKDGLHFIEFESPDVERRSDLFPMKNFLYNFPYARVPLLASNRAADAAANIARYELYKQGERRLLNQKITRENHPEEYEGLARWVNTITGSGKMLKFIEESHGLKKFLGNTLYGAKLMASRFNMLSPKYWAKLPPAVKREAIKDMISFTGTLMAMGIAARAAGARVSLNPNDSEFLKIRIGNKVYDITGGIGNYVRMFLRLSGLIMSRGKYLTGNMSKQENARNIDRGLTSLNTFIQSKLAPNTSFAISALTGKNAIGQPFDPYDALRVYPMYIDDIIDGFNDSGFTSLFTVLLPSLEGEGVNVYPSRDANYSQEFKDNPVIKYYTEEWGMQLPNVRLKNQKIPNTKKTIDDYPKEKQDEYIKAHNNELLKVLTYIKDRGYVYKSEEGDISLYGNPGDEQIRLDDLKDDWDKAQVMSLAQGRASLLAKRKVFGR